MALHTVRLEAVNNPAGIHRAGEDRIDSEEADCRNIVAILGLQDPRPYELAKGRKVAGHLVLSIIHY